MAVSPLHKPVFAGGMQIVEGVDAACATLVGPRQENQDRCAWPRPRRRQRRGGRPRRRSRAAQLTVDTVLGLLAGLADPPGPAELAAAVSRANDAVRAGRRGRPRRVLDGCDGDPGRQAQPLPDPGARTGAARWLVAHVGDSPGWLVGEAGHIASPTTTPWPPSWSARAHWPPRPGRDPPRAPHARAGHRLGGPCRARRRPGRAGPGRGAGAGVRRPCRRARRRRDPPGGGATATAEEAATALVDASLAAGTRDNVTTVVVRRRHPRRMGLPEPDAPARMTLRVKIHPAPWVAEFPRDHIVRVGRGRTNDVRVGHELVGGRFTVSKNHFQLRWDGTRWSTLNVSDKPGLLAVYEPGYEEVPLEPGRPWVPVRHRWSYALGSPATASTWCAPPTTTRTGDRVGLRGPLPHPGPEAAADAGDAGTAAMSTRSRPRGWTPSASSPSTSRRSSATCCSPTTPTTRCSPARTAWRPARTRRRPAGWAARRTRPARPSSGSTRR